MIGNKIIVKEIYHAENQTWDWFARLKSPHYRDHQSLQGKMTAALIKAFSKIN